MLYMLGIELGLTKNDIDQIIQDIPRTNDCPSLSLGPPFYPGGGRYGTVSIKDFCT
jgi:hypothetical protein